MLFRSVDVQSDAFEVPVRSLAESERGKTYRTRLELALDLTLHLVLSDLALPPAGGILSRVLRTRKDTPPLLRNDLVAINERDVRLKVFLHTPSAPAPLL